MGPAGRGDCQGPLAVDGLQTWVCPGLLGEGGEKQWDEGITWEPPCGGGGGRLHTLREWASG